MSKPPKRRIGPGMRTAGVTVLDRIIVDIVTQRGEFLLATYQVFPKTSLPDRLFVLFVTRGALLSFYGHELHQLPGGGVFDQPPAGREVHISSGEGPEGMQMVGQQDDSIDTKVTFGTNALDRVAQGTSSPGLPQKRLPLVGYNSKGEGRAGDAGTGIGRHRLGA